MRKVAVLGSTGSIGRNTLEVISRHPDRLQLFAVAAHSRILSLAEQMARFSNSANGRAHLPLVAVFDEAKAKELARLTGRSDVGMGLEGLVRLATHPEVDVVVVATSGCEALIPLLRAIEAGKRVALASKELLVMAGPLIMRLVREHGTSLVPIDSEHAALLQCLQGAPSEQVRRLVITGSGGPLWDTPLTERSSVRREQVLSHPKWRMGPKITVDSATLMNKGLELIEARWLFGVPLERLEVVIHPEAAVHALVELVDGSLLAQMAPCDMRLPIQYALSFPERWESAVPSLQIARLSSLRFFEPDLERFPCLRLALEAAAAGGSSCVALNGANEEAVRAYLDGKLGFEEIPHVIGEVLAEHAPISDPSLEAIFSIDHWSRQAARERIQGRRFAARASAAAIGRMG